MLRDDDEAEDESLLVREDDKGGRTAPVAVVVWCRAASCDEGAGVEVEPDGGCDDGGVADLEPDDWLLPMPNGRET